MHTFAFIRRARVLAVLLSAVLVAACAMPALWRMDCHTTGESELAWVDIEACCHPDVPVQVPELKHHCCDYSHAEAGLDPSEELAVQKHSVVLDVAELAPPRSGWVRCPLSLLRGRGSSIRHPGPGVPF